MLRKCGNEDEKGVEVGDNDGKFMLTESIHDKYSLRPLVVALMCLVQFFFNCGSLSAKKRIWIYKEIDTEEKIIVCQDHLESPPEDNLIYSCLSSSC